MPMRSKAADNVRVIMENLQFDIERLALLAASGTTRGWLEPPLPRGRFLRSAIAEFLKRGDRW
jgi:hypothetical protein